MFYAHGRSSPWFPNKINTDEFRDNLVPNFGKRVFGEHHPTGLQFKPPDEAVKGRGVLAIHYAINALRAKGHNDVAEAMCNEIRALCDRIDELSKEKK